MHQRFKVAMRVSSIDLIAVLLQGLGSEAKSWVDQERVFRHELIVSSYTPGEKEALTT
jgi:hypothetical protein